MEHAAAVILAAGDGKRMKSGGPKVLCQVLLKPMLSWVVDACLGAGIAPGNLCAVISDQPGEIPALLPEGAATALQAQRRGTGHAVMAAEAFLQAHRGEDILVLCGDAPFITPEVIGASLREHRQRHNAVTVLSAVLEEGGSYGRIDRQGGGVRIVERADADQRQLQICEVNSGCYWFEQPALLEALGRLGCENAQGEYYLTDTLAILQQMGQRAGVFCCPDAQIARGANTREELAALNQLARGRVIARLRQQGVDIPLEEGVLIGPDVQMGPDCQVLPGVTVTGHSRIGAGCRLAGDCLVDGCEIGPGCQVLSSRLEGCRIGEGARLEWVSAQQAQVGPGCRVGPFVHLRPGTQLSAQVKVGNFVEVKNSTVGEKTSLAHLTYIGDSDVGAGVNVGCGVVTVNYNGSQKFRTTIGDNAFIGCNCNLVAPVQVGEGSYLAAGSTITRDVPPGALAIGRARQQNKEGYAQRMGLYPGKK